MKYDAIIFDLFGTLVDNFPTKAFERVLTDMAHILHAPPQDFIRLWNIDTWPKRATGGFPTLESAIEHICNILHVSVSEEQVQTAVQMRYDYTQRMLVPRHDTLETLSHLKSAGYKIGLISDCTIEVPQRWESISLAPLIDVPIFSCSVGLKKPDARIYLLACERLGVLPQHCLYVGDGGSRELSGAIAVGMYPILIRVPYEELDLVHRHESETWKGPRVSTLKDVLAYVDDAEIDGKVV